MGSQSHPASRGAGERKQQPIPMVGARSALFCSTQESTADPALAVVLDESGGRKACHEKGLRLYPANPAREPTRAKAFLPLLLLDLGKERGTGIKQASRRRCPFHSIGTPLTPMTNPLLDQGSSLRIHNDLPYLSSETSGRAETTRGGLTHRINLDAGDQPAEDFPMGRCREHRTTPYSGSYCILP